ncbi:MAG: O-antigen ligase family protein [Fibrobacteres bacterium]|nr:O-antigen ligase family protein [Fibrobacterota bacterium]
MQELLRNSFLKITGIGRLSIRTRDRLLFLLRNGILLMAAAVSGTFIARKIAAVPDRKEVVVFLFAVLTVPILKFPAFGLAVLCVLPLFLSWIRRLFYLVSDRVSNDPLLLLPDIIAALLMFALIDKLRKGERLKSPESGLQWLILFFIGYQLLRVFVLNSGTVLALQAFKFDVFFITVFFFAIYFVKSFDQVVAVLRLTAVLALLLALYGIKQVFIGYTSFEELWLDQMRTEFVTMFIAGTPRPFSMLASPATFADFMLIGMIAALAAGSLRNRGGSFFYYLFIPVMGLALLLTSVRSNWVGALAAAFMWFLIAHRTSFKKKVVSIVVVMLIGLPLSYAAEEMGGTSILDKASGKIGRQIGGGERSVTDLFVKERVTAITNPFEEHSMQARITMWLFVLSRSIQLPQGPIGWGPGSFNAHNYYLTVLYETGYIGTILLLIILFRIFRAGYRLYLEEEHPDKRVVVRAIIATLSAICVLNTTGPHTSSHPADIYFWGGAGLLLIIHRLPYRNENGFKLKSGRLTDPT